MADPKWSDSWSRTCPECEEVFTVSQATLELREYGAVEKCPNCGHEIEIRGEFQEEAVSFKIYGRSP